MIFHIFVTCLLPGHFLTLQAHSGTNYYCNYFSPLEIRWLQTNGLQKVRYFLLFLCEVCLNPEDPYKHFSNPDSKCYNLLFHTVLNLHVDDYHWWNAGGIFV